MKLRAIMLGCTHAPVDAMNHPNLALREHIPLICPRHLPAAEESVNQGLLPTITQISLFPQTTYTSWNSRLAPGERG